MNNVMKAMAGLALVAVEGEEERECRLEKLLYIYRYRGEWKFTSAFFQSWMRRYA